MIVIKSWDEIEELAKRAEVRLVRTKHGVTVYPRFGVIQQAFFTITGGDLEDDDQDQLFRKTVTSALEVLYQLLLETREDRP